MPKIAATLQTAKSDDPLWLRMRNVWEKAARVVNGMLSFGDGTNADNISGVWVTVTLPAANTDFTVTHNLQRAAVGYIQMAASAAGSVYTSPTVNADPAHTIILRSTAGIGTTLTLFII